MGFGTEKVYSDSEVVSDRTKKKRKKQRNLNAGADILIKWDRGIAGRSCPMRRMTLEKTRKQKRGIQRRVGFPT